MPKRSRRSDDPVRRALDAVEQAIGGPLNPDTKPEPKKPEKPKNPAAVELGRLGGLKGGKARKDRLTPEQRSESARKAALRRWGSTK